MSNQVAVITGASRGIGRAIALKYAKAGYDIAICCKNSETALKKVSDAIISLGVSCLTFIGDMGISADVNAFFAAIDDTFHRVDILINNAGISYIGLLQDMDDATWENIISTNLNSIFYCSRAAIKRMLPKKQGKILSISSVWGIVGASTEVAYSTTKGGMNAFTKALAKELAPSNIQVNAIACGIIDTEMNGFLNEDEKRAILEELPAGRMGTAEEVAELAYQLNQKNDYLTAQIITLDGGWI